MKWVTQNDCILGVAVSQNLSLVLVLVSFGVIWPLRTATPLGSHCCIFCILQRYFIFMFNITNMRALNGVVAKFWLVKGWDRTESMQLQRCAFYLLSCIKSGSYGHSLTTGFELLSHKNINLESLAVPSLPKRGHHPEAFTQCSKHTEFICGRPRTTLRAEKVPWQCLRFASSPIHFHTQICSTDKKLVTPTALTFLGNGEVDSRPWRKLLDLLDAASTSI